MIFRDVTVTLGQNILIFVSNTSQLVGLVHFIIKDWNYLAFWKKSTLNQVLRFLNVSVYMCLLGTEKLLKCAFNTSKLFKYAILFLKDKIAI